MTGGPAGGEGYPAGATDGAGADADAEDVDAADVEAAGSGAADAAFVMALRGRGLRDTAVLRAMEQVPREAFAPAEYRAHARRDIALPLPCGAAMAAPAELALMLEALRVEPGQRVLEIGTGSGYAAALLARLGAGVVLSLERYRTLAEDAAARLAGLPEVRVMRADGLDPRLPNGGFDRILAHGAVAAIPEHWRAALTPGGRLVTGLGAGPACRIARIIADEPTPRLGPPVRLAPLMPGLARLL